MLDAAATTVMKPSNVPEFAESIIGSVIDTKAYDALIDIGPSRRVDVVFKGKSAKAVAPVAAYVMLILLLAVLYTGLGSLRKMRPGRNT